MNQPTNEQRADRVYEYIDDYACNEDLEECIIDVLTDLHHLCEQQGINFLECYITARSHYEEESK